MTSNDFSLYVFIFVLYLLFPSAIQAEKSKGGEALFHLLPAGSKLHEWKLDGDPETAVGIELFELINGGAEIYAKAGFKRAILASYRNNKGKMINIEIFEMTSNENAGNVHQQKIGENGKKISVGEDAVLSSYYLNFRQGRFQVTVAGYDSKEETIKILLEMARIVSGKIDSLP